MIASLELYTFFVSASLANYSLRPIIDDLLG